MFAKRLLQMAHNPHQGNLQHRSVNPTDLDPHIALHYGIPSSASVLAFDPIQRLLAIGTLDGRIKVIGGDNIEGLLISPKQLPFKNLEFLHNQGFIVSVTNENDIQVWDLENRHMACSLVWETNITAFSVISGTPFMYVGDEYGLMSVLKYDANEGKLLKLPYHIPADLLAEAAGISLPDHQTIVGLLPQPCTSGNRVLIAYEHGLLILWDVCENRVVLVRGYEDLQLKDEGVVNFPTGADNEFTDDTSNHDQEEKEISSLCWASTNGSVLAVGYVDGDIMLWNTSSASSAKSPQAGTSSNNVVKLQLCSSKRRLPVIVLQWSPRSGLHDNAGHLFIYGGDEIGSEEVLTILSLEWSSGIETVKCVARLDLTLNGSFSDMILIPHAGARENNHTAALFVLTNPGQLHVYDDSSLSSTSQKDKNTPIPAIQFPVAVPTVDPCMTVAKLSLLPRGGNSSKALLEIASVMKARATAPVTVGTKWPVSGGTHSPLSFSEDKEVERVYIAGYQDGSVRIWDATYPVLSLLYVIEGEVQGIKVTGARTSVTALDFCCLTASFAIGNECGLVHIYKPSGSSSETSFHFITETNNEVHITYQEKGLQCVAAFSVLNSPIQTLQYEKSGSKLAIGYECGRVALLSMDSLSILFLTDCISASSSAVISMALFSQIPSIISSPKHSVSQNQNETKGVIFILTRDAHIVVVDSATGKMINSQSMHLKKGSTAISMYVIEDSTLVPEVSHDSHPKRLSQGTACQDEPVQENTAMEIKQEEAELHATIGSTFFGERLLDSLLLLCCEDSLCLYTIKSVVQGDNDSIRKVNLVKPICWSTTFMKDEKMCGLIIVYQTGVIEIRSLPDLEVVNVTSLMLILRWSFKTNMDKMMSSSCDGNITLANGCELAFISFLASENGFRIPESLPCLHDKTLAAAANAAIGFSSNQKKKQITAPSILGGIIKGFKGGKTTNTEDFNENLASYNITANLETMFSRLPFSEPFTTTEDHQEMELSIDDIEIDEPIPVASTSSLKGRNDRKEKETEREKLFEGATVDIKPRLRTPEEIIATYRKTGDVSKVATQARQKLAERQEKLERINRNTEELQSGAQSFAEMANELAKTMESRKRWFI